MRNEPDLSATPSESVKLSDSLAAEVGSPSQPLPGFVAILDALGAAAYSEKEADQFLKVRDQVVQQLSEPDIVGGIDKNDLKRFIFNDTFVLSYVRKSLTPEDINNFCGLLRGLEAYFITKRILFRGALSFGDIYRVDELTNTVMGPAVSDAAAWYDRSDWIGIHTTPQATILISSFLQDEPNAFDHVLLDYHVPFKGQGTMNLKAINWPKTLYLVHKKDSKRAKTALLRVLGTRSVPAGSESKYLHAIEFYDHCEKRTFSKPSRR